MPKSTYVVLDTNILIRYCTQGLPGCEPDLLDSILGHRGDSTTFLLPEVIELEFKKFHRTMEEELKDKLASFPDFVKDKCGTVSKSWNELTSFSLDVTARLNHLITERAQATLEEWQRRYDTLSETLTCCTERIPFTPEIMYEGKRRQLEGLTKPKGSWDGDLLIVQSLVAHFRELSVSLDECQLLFCTENLADFGVSVDKKHALYLALKDGLPATELFTDLKTLAAFMQAHLAVIEPTTAEVEKATKDYVEWRQKYLPGSMPNVFVLPSGDMISAATHPSGLEPPFPFAADKYKTVLGGAGTTVHIYSTTTTPMPLSGQSVPIDWRSSEGQHTHTFVLREPAPPTAPQPPQAQNPPDAAQ